MKPNYSCAPRCSSGGRQLFPLFAALALALAGGMLLSPVSVAANEPGERMCISLNRAVSVAEGHRANGARVTMLSERGEVDRWYEVVTASAGWTPVERPDLIIVISYTDVTYAHIANGGSVCDGAQIPSDVGREAMDAARGTV